MVNYLRRGLANTFFFALASLFAKGSWLIAMPYVLGKLTLSNIGLFDVYQSAFLIVSLMISSIAAQPFGRFYLKYRNNFALQQQTVSLNLAIILLCALICMLLALIGLARYMWCGDCYFVMFCALNIALFSCFSFITYYYQIQERIKEYMFLYCGQSIVALCILFIFLKLGHGIIALFWANGISYLLAIPAFLGLCKQWTGWNKSLVYEQLRYSVPLLIYNMVYMLLFAVDRWYLAYRYGYELVGLYAVLWYFGRIFVYGTLALYDASPMLMYNAQHEENGAQIIAHTVRYVTIFYVTGAIFLVPIAMLILYYFLPLYMHLAHYLPLFITSLLFVEIGKFFQVGFHVATKTEMIPWISLAALIIQCIGLLLFGYLGLLGILLANSLAFFCYAIMNSVGSSRLYSKELFQLRHLMPLFCLYALYMLFFWYNVAIQLNYFGIVAALMFWPIFIYFAGVLSDDERVYLLQLFKKIARIA